MISDLAPYPAYRDSGVEWLGSVPSGWAFRRGKQLFRKMDRKVRDTDEIVTCFRDGNVTLRRNRRTTGFTEAIQESGYQGVRRGDLVIHQMDAFAGAIGVSDSDGKASPVYAVCVPRKGVYAHFYQHVVREMARRGWLVALARGVRERSSDFRFEAFGRQLLPVPSPPEQVEITRFLDHVDSRIHRLIAARERLIELLKEEKQTIIYRAVTRGIDANVRLKPSGVAWLGDVPEHWEIVPLKQCAVFRSGAGFPVVDQGDSSGEIPFVKVSDMNLPGNEQRIVDATNRVSPKVAAELGAFVFPAGTVIFPKVGGALMTNKRRVLHSPCCVDNNVMGAVLKPNVDAEFMFELLKVVDLRRFASLGPVPAISEREVRGIRIAIPLRQEQMAISRYISREVRDHAAALGSCERQVFLLREYRTRLISDVVTGKLDVREAANRLPDDPDVDDPALDERLEEVAAR